MSVNYRNFPLRKDISGSGSGSESESDNDCKNRVPSLFCFEESVESLLTEDIPSCEHKPIIAIKKFYWEHIHRLKEKEDALITNIDELTYIIDQWICLDESYTLASLPMLSNLVKNTLVKLKNERDQLIAELATGKGIIIKYYEKLLNIIKNDTQ